MENDKVDQNKQMEQWRDENELQVLLRLLKINCQELRSLLKQQRTLNLPGAVGEHKKRELHLRRIFSDAIDAADEPIFCHSAKKQSRHRRRGMTQVSDSQYTDISPE